MKQQLELLDKYIKNKDKNTPESQSIVKEVTPEKFTDSNIKQIFFVHYNPQITNNNNNQQYSV